MQVALSFEASTILPHGRNLRQRGSGSRHSNANASSPGVRSRIGGMTVGWVSTHLGRGSDQKAVGWVSSVSYGLQFEYTDCGVWARTAFVSPRRLKPAAQGCAYRHVYTGTGLRPTALSHTATKQTGGSNDPLAPLLTSGRKAIPTSLRRERWVDGQLNARYRHRRSNEMHEPPRRVPRAVPAFER